MDRVFWVLALGASAGCAQLFGIDNTSGQPDAPPPGKVSISFDRLSVGASVKRAAADLTGQPARYFVDDGMMGFTRVDATVGPMNTWSATIPTGTPAVEFTLPEATPFRRNWALPQRDILALWGVYETQNAQPAPTGATLQLQATLDTPYANELLRIYAVGPWQFHDLAGTDLPVANTTAINTAAIPWDMTGWATINGKPPTAITPDDQLVLLRYSGNDLISSAEIPPFAQTGTDAISATFTPNTQTQLSLTVAAAEVANRLSQTSPQNMTLGMAWYVDAAPGYSIANNTGPQLNAAGMTGTETTITGNVGNPFAAHGWNTTLLWQSYRTRAITVAAMGGLPVTLYCGLNEYVEPTPGLSLKQNAGLPVLVSVNGTPLTSDNKMLSIDTTKPVQLSLSVDQQPNTYYQFNIYELAPNTANTALEYHIAYLVEGPATTLTVPGDAFTTGKTYTVRANAINGGYPKFAQGDLTERGLPLAIGYLDSGVFTVTP